MGSYSAKHSFQTARRPKMDKVGHSETSCLFYKLPLLIVPEGCSRMGASSLTHWFLDSNISQVVLTHPTVGLSINLR